MYLLIQTVHYAASAHRMSQCAVSMNFCGYLRLKKKNTDQDSPD